MNHTALNTTIINDSLLNQGELCEVCFEKDDEDLYIVFNALYRITVGEVFQQGSENTIDEFDLNPMSIYSSQRREDESKANQEKLQLFRNKVSTQTLLELISSPRFDLLLREIFKSKYNRVQDTNCKHKELAMNFIRNFNLKNDEHFENSDAHKRRALENAEKLDLMYAKVKQLKSEIESYHNEIDDLSDRIIKKLLPNHSQSTNKKLHLTEDEHDNSDDGSSDTSESYIVKKTNNIKGSSGSGNSSTGISSEAISSEITPNEKQERKHKKSKTATFKSKLPKKATDVLKNWFLNNIKNPYPSHEAKEMLSKMTGLTRKQIQNWFTNSRKRFLEPIKKKIGNQGDKDDIMTLERIQGIFSPESHSQNNDSEAAPAALPEASPVSAKNQQTLPTLKSTASFPAMYQNYGENLPIRSTPFQKPTVVNLTNQQATQPIIFPNSLPQANLQPGNNFMVLPFMLPQPMYQYIPSVPGMPLMNNSQFMPMQQGGLTGGYPIISNPLQFMNNQYMLPMQQQSMLPMLQQQQQQQANMLNLNEMIKQQLPAGFSTVNNNVFNINQPSNIGQTIYNQDRMGLANNRSNLENQMKANDKSRFNGFTEGIPRFGSDIVHPRPELSEPNYLGTKLLHKN